ncbi:hypothetical protein KEM56_003549 [Ascosphaera pollenicola]|nr:hypothetical protein KEM56_003549 [Ascosphaera pollenicola]
MALELHVWGPAFGLPSIDAECLAAIIYLALAVPKIKPDSSEEQWVIIPDAETAAVPTNELPALRNPSGYWVSGFRNIVHYLDQYSDGQWNLDSWTTEKERADCFAYSSFLKAKASTLIDLSLYVSSENYDNATHLALFKLLNWWPNTWIIPRRMRDDAKSRTAHLGLTGLDLHDALKEQRKDSREAIAESQIPKSLQKTPKDSVSEALARGATVSPTRIQLDAMVTELVKPLHHLLASHQSKTYLIGEGDRPTSLDCIAIGYLSIALIPGLPSPWLRDSIASQSAQLVAYVDQLQDLVFGKGPYKVEIMPSQAESTEVRQQEDEQVPDLKLPIRLATPPALRTVTNTIIDSLLGSIPIIPSTWRARRSVQQPQPTHIPSPADASSEETETPEIPKAVAQARRREKLTTWGTYALGGAAFIGYLISAGIVNFSLGGQEEELQEEEEAEFDLGEAGQLLGI